MKDVGSPSAVAPTGPRTRETTTLAVTGPSSVAWTMHAA